MIDSNKLKYYRELNNYTLGDVAKKIKRSKKVIEDWELGNSIPDDNNLNKLAKLYNVNIEDFLYKNDTTKLNIFIIIILIILGFVEAFILKNVFMYIIPLINVGIYLSYVYLKNNYIKINDEEPRSVFNYKLEEDKKDRIKLYLIECNIISSCYLVFDSICEIFSLELFIFNINIVSNDSVNKLLIFILVYLLLFILSFIIELVFGEYMNKKYKGDK